MNCVELILLPTIVLIIVDRNLEESSELEVNDELFINPVENNYRRVAFALAIDRDIFENRLQSTCTTRSALMSRMV